MLHDFAYLFPHDFTDCLNLITRRNLFGTAVFHLASDESLLFWGGEKSIPIYSIQREELRSGRAPSIIQMQATMERPMLDFRIAAGPAGRSRCVGHDKLVVVQPDLYVFAGAVGLMFVSRVQGPSSEELEREASSTHCSTLGSTCTYP